MRGGGDWRTCSEYQTAIMVNRKEKGKRIGSTSAHDTRRRRARKQPCTQGCSNVRTDNRHRQREGAVTHARTARRTNPESEQRQRNQQRPTGKAETETQMNGSRRCRLAASAHKHTRTQAKHAEGTRSYAAQGTSHVGRHRHTRTHALRQSQRERGGGGEREASFAPRHKPSPPEKDVLSEHFCREGERKKGGDTGGLRRVQIRRSRSRSSEEGSLFFS